MKYKYANSLAPEKIAPRGSSHLLVEEAIRA